jgi:hypothetical protein
LNFGKTVVDGVAWLLGDPEWKQRKSNWSAYTKIQYTTAPKTVSGINNIARVKQNTMW